MNTTEIIQEMGGRQAVIELTQLSKGRISQWEKQNHIPRAWRVAFYAMNSRVPPPDANLAGVTNAKSQRPGHSHLATNSTPAD